MSQKTGIQWTDRSSNPLRYRDAAGNDVWACVKKSTGCAHCYSETLALRYGKGAEFTAANMRTLTPYVRDKELKELLSPKKTPAGSKVFVCDMTDLFGDWVPFELVDRVFAAFALRPDVVFQVLTKRPDRMAGYLTDTGASKQVSRAVCDLLGTGRQPDHLDDVFSREVLWVSDGQRLRPNGLETWPLENVWVGTSVENQATADERIPHLLRCPAAVRFLSCEPLLGPVNLERVKLQDAEHPENGQPPVTMRALSGWHGGANRPDRTRIDWVIVGGESGGGSRPIQIEWARSLVGQCRAVSVPVFVKQLGGMPASDDDRDADHAKTGTKYALGQILFHDKKGGDIDEFPPDLRVRQFPEVLR